MSTSNKSPNTTSIDSIFVQRQLTRSLAVILALGLLGNFTSCVVFRQKQFRSNSISLIFTAVSLFNIIVLAFGVGTSLYSLDHMSSGIHSTAYCQLRIYFRHILLMIVRSYIALACVASFALSSPRTTWRFLCQPRFVKRILFVVPCLWPLIALHIPFFKTLRNGKCVDADTYVLPFATYAFVVIGVLPIVLMSSFILLTIRNLRVLRCRIRPSVANPTRVKSRDQQFIRMLVALVVLYVATNLFYPVNILYSAVTYWTEKSAERVAIESIVYSVTEDYVVYINNLAPFFLFVCASRTFRQSLVEVFHDCVRYITRRDMHQRTMSVTSVPKRTYEPHPGVCMITVVRGGERK